MNNPSAEPTNSALPACAGPEERVFAEFRRKVRDSELLSAALLRLLYSLRFTGRLSIVVQNGRVLKSGYEEGYFSRKNDQRLVP